MPRGRAIMKSIESCGTYIDPNTSEVQIQMLINVVYVGVDSSVTTDQATAIISFNALDNIIQDTIKQGIIDRGSALGFDIRSGDVLLLSPARF